MYQAGIVISYHEREAEMANIIERVAKQLKEVALCRREYKQSDMSKHARPLITARLTGNKYKYFRILCL